MINSESSTVVSLGRVPTVNGARYNRANATVMLNPHGLPVAWRRVVALQQSGSFAHSKHQVITPDSSRGVTVVSGATKRRQIADCHPLN